MTYPLGVPFVILLYFCSPLVAVDSLLELRREFKEVGTDGLSVANFERLSERALNLTVGAGKRGKFWNSIGFVAELCEAGPYGAVLDVRAHALDILVHRFTDTHRWSNLMSSRFTPFLERIPRASWRRQIKIYSDVLNTLIESTNSDRVKAELLYAKAIPWIQIDRRWDWCTNEDRRATLQLLKNIQDQYGTLPCPGSRGDSVDTVGARAVAHEYELRHLHFNAPAPNTAGMDLRGQPLDIADYKGEIILLDFWTSFCTPCLAMVPETRRLLETFRDEPVVYIGVNGDPKREQGLATEKRLNMPWRNLWDKRPNGHLATLWRVRGTPSLFVIDGAGRIRYKFRGKDQIDAGLESVIHSLLQERIPQP